MPVGVPCIALAVRGSIVVFHRIRVHDMSGAKLLAVAENGNKLRVDFNGGDVAARFKERLREGARSRADLDDARAGSCSIKSEPRNTLRGSAIHQEVLSEFLFRTQSPRLKERAGMLFTGISIHRCGAYLIR